MVNKKLIAALKHHLAPIVCVGEGEEERERGLTEQVCCRQVEGAIKELDAARMHSMVIAYEPIWAIGTGKTATPAIAAEAHLMIRSEVARGTSRARRPLARCAGGSGRSASCAGRRRRWLWPRAEAAGLGCAAAL